MRRIRGLRKAARSNRQHPNALVVDLTLDGIVIDATGEELITE